MVKDNLKNNIRIILLSTLLLISYIFIFIRFFPNKYGLLGHDYSLLFPALLDNYIWIKKNGLLEIPWFTPSFCGGLLNFTHPQGLPYSIPYILTIFFDPLSVVIMTFFLFALIGFLSAYLLFRSGFNISRPAALYGAGVFLFNGFYSHRMLIGHFGFPCFMIIPLLAFFLIRPIIKTNKSSLSQYFILDICAAGILFAYMVYSGYLTLMIPSILAIIIVGIIHGLLYPQSRLLFWFKLAGSGLVGILLSSSKLVTITYIMGSYTRSDYKLPGAEGFLASLWLIIKSLFTSPAFDIKRVESLVNQQWYLDRHEWEYSLTIIPLIIIIWGLIKISISIKKGESHGIYPSIKRHYLACIALIFLLLIPVALNAYSPAWNAFLKKLPLIKSASSLIRWYIIYIPFIILVSAITIEKTIGKKIQWFFVTLCLIAVVLINGLTNHDFYNHQFYDPWKIQEAYYKVKTGEWNPEIKYIAVYRDEKDQVARHRFEVNDMLIHNASQLFCYEPLLGYDLENFPQKSLHPGPVMDEYEGNLNIKNPACYVWPAANSCEPGDHFKISQKEEASSFVKYEPFHFEMPLPQKIANWWNIFFLIVVSCYLLHSFIRFLLTSSLNSRRTNGN